MIEAAIEWNEKNISDYVKYTVFGKNKSTKVYIALYAVFMALIAVCYCRAGRARVPPSGCCFRRNRPELPLI